VEQTLYLIFDSRGFQGNIPNNYFLLSEYLIKADNNTQFYFMEIKVSINNSELLFDSWYCNLNNTLLAFRGSINFLKLF